MIHTSLVIIFSFFFRTMAKWFLLILIVTLLGRRANFEIFEETCQFHRSPLKGLQLTCINVNSDFFQNFKYELNGTHWLRCNNCSLELLDENTFDIPRKNNISFIDLSSSGIQILKKFAFGKFFLLKMLVLRNNSIDTMDTMSFNGVKRLVQLDLSSNCLRIITNNLFSDLENLDVLNLNMNNIFYIQPEAFTNLINLKYLYLNHNCMTKLEAKIFKHLANLKILYLEYNQIEEIHPNAFDNLKNLNLLYMNNNSINFLVQYNFKPLVSLLDLQLRNNNLTEIQTSAFNGMINLRSLYLGRNHLFIIRPYGLVGLDNLEILDLMENEFENINYFEYFSSLGSLKHLYLQRNNINNLSVTFQYEVQNSLTLLDLCRNNLTSFNYRFVQKNLPNIKEILVANNSWSCEFFKGMYSFFRSINISVCVSIDCNFSKTDKYLEKICTNNGTNVEDIVDEISTDFVADCAAKIVCTVVFIPLFTVIALIQR